MLELLKLLGLEVSCNDTVTAIATCCGECLTTLESLKGHADAKPNCINHLLITSTLHFDGVWYAGRKRVIATFSPLVSNEALMCFLET